MARFDGKTAIVSGGARGMGASHVRALVGEGARVLIGDVLEADGAALARELGDAARFVHLDVTDGAGWRAAVAAAQAAFGSVEDQTPEDFRLLLEINLVGAFFGMRAVLLTMRRQRRGSVVKSPQRLAWSGTQA